MRVRGDHICQLGNGRLIRQNANVEPKRQRRVTSNWNSAQLHKKLSHSKRIELINTLHGSGIRIRHWTIITMSIGRTMFASFHSSNIHKEGPVRLNMQWLSNHVYKQASKQSCIGTLLGLILILCKRVVACCWLDTPATTMKDRWDKLICMTQLWHNRNVSGMPMNMAVMQFAFRFTNRSLVQNGSKGTNPMPMKWRKGIYQICHRK